MHVRAILLLIFLAICFQKVHTLVTWEITADTLLNETTVLSDDDQVIISGRNGVHSPRVSSASNSVQLFVIDAPTVLIANLTLSDGASTHGGCVFLSPSVTTVSLIGVIFERCTASVAGGALYLSTNSTLDVKVIDCLFTSCSAEFSASSNLTMVEPILGGGAAIAMAWMDGGNSTSLQMQNVTANNCNASARIREIASVGEFTEGVLLGGVFTFAFACSACGSSVALTATSVTVKHCQSSSNQTASSGVQGLTFIQSIGLTVAFLGDGSGDQLNANVTELDVFGSDLVVDLDREAAVAGVFLFYATHYDGASTIHLAQASFTSTSLVQKASPGNNALVGLFGALCILCDGGSMDVTCDGVYARDIWVEGSLAFGVIADNGHGKANFSSPSPVVVTSSKWIAAGPLSLLGVLSVAGSEVTTAVDSLTLESVVLQYVAALAVVGTTTNCTVKVEIGDFFAKEAETTQGFILLRDPPNIMSSFLSSSVSFYGTVELVSCDGSWLLQGLWLSEGAGTGLQVDMRPSSITLFGGELLAFFGLFWTKPGSGSYISISVNSSIAVRRATLVNGIVQATWNEAYSGNNVDFVFSGSLSFEQAVASFFALEWLGQSSGSNVTLVTRSFVSFYNSTLAPQVPTCSWLGENSGHNFGINFLSLINLTDCNSGGATTLPQFLSFNWSAPYSGDDVSAVFTGDVLLNDVLLSDYYFSFYWTSAYSGNGFRLSSTGAWDVGSATVSLVSMTWNGHNSGNKVSIRLNTSPLFVHSSPWDTKIIEAVWEAEASGNELDLSLDGLIAIDELYGERSSSSLFGFIWSGADSGKDVAAIVNATMLAAHSVNGVRSVLLSFSWYGSNSGEGTILQMMEYVVVSDCVNVGVVLLLWRHGQSGSNASVELLAPITLQDVDIGDGGFVLAFIWVGDGGGHDFALQLNSAMSVFGGSTIYGFLVMQWEGNDCGHRLSATSLPSAAIQVIGDSRLVQIRFFVTMVWVGDYNGNSASIMWNNALFSNTTLPHNGSGLFIHEWQGTDSGQNLLLNVSHMEAHEVYVPVSLTWFVAASWFEERSGNYSTMLIDSFFGRNIQFGQQFAGLFSMYFSKAVGEHSRIVVENTIVQQSSFGGFFILSFWELGASDSSSIVISSLSVVQVQCPNSLVVARSWKLPSVRHSIQLRDITVVNATIDSIIEDLFASYEDALLIAQNVVVSGSNLAIVSVNITGSAFNQSLSIFVDGVQVNNGNCSIVSGWAWSPGASGLLTLGIRSIFGNGVRLSVLQLRSQGVEMLVNASVSSVQCLNCDAHITQSIWSSGGFLSISGLGGWLEMTTVVLTGSNLDPSAWLFADGARESLTIAISNCSIDMQTVLPPLMSVGTASNAIFANSSFRFGTVLPSGSAIIQSQSSQGPASLLEVGKGFVLDVKNLKDSPSSRVVFETTRGVSQLIVEHVNVTTGEVFTDDVNVNGWHCPYGSSLSWHYEESQQFTPDFASPPRSCLAFLREQGQAALGTCLQSRSSLRVSCKPCESGYMSINRGSLLEKDVGCKPCSRAMSCSELDPGQALISRGFWAPADLKALWWAAKKNGTSDALTPMELSDVIVQCPLGVCEPENEYSIANGELEGSPCTLNRAGVLCSECKEGYSAYAFSSVCVETCTWSAFDYFIASAVILCGVAYAVYLSLRAITPYSPWPRIVAYYYGVLQLVFHNSSNGSSLSIVAHVLMVLMGGGRATYQPTPLLALCVPGATPLQVMLGYLAIPAVLMILFSVISVFFVARTPKHRRKAGDELTTRIGGGFFSLTLFSYSTTAGVLFSVIQCTDIPVPLNSSAGSDIVIEMQSRLSYHASHACWTESWWQVLLVIIGALVVFGGPILLLLWQFTMPFASRPFQNCWRRGKPPGLWVLLPLEGALKKELYFWDSLVFIRRAVLEAISVYISDSLVRQFVLSGFNVFFFGVHCFIRPFTSHAANVVEGICLGILVIIGLLNIPVILRNELFLTTASAEESEQIASSIEDAQTVFALLGALLIVITVLVIYIPKIRLAGKRFAERRFSSNYATSWCSCCSQRRRKRGFSAHELESVHSSYQKPEDTSEKSSTATKLPSGRLTSLFLLESKGDMVDNLSNVVWLSTGRRASKAKQGEREAQRQTVAGAHEEKQLAIDTEQITRPQRGKTVV